MRDFPLGASPLLTGLAFLVALGPAGGVSCGGGGGSNQTSSCQAACRRCGSDLCVDCAATSARFRDEFETALYACVLGGSDASCDVVWTNCAVQAQVQVTQRPQDATYRDACLAKRSACGSSGTGFADDYCLQSVLVEASVVAQAQQCLSQSCPAIGTCLQALFH
jgi:hypothetical protein